MTKDIRQQRVTITMTVEQWDSLSQADDSRYAEHHEAVARAKIAQAIGPAKNRRALSYNEAVRRHPRLTSAGKRKLGEGMKAALEAFRERDLHVDHLGSGLYPKTMHADGYSVSLIPQTVNGEQNFQLALARPVWFERSAIPIDEADKRWFIKRVGQIASAGHNDPWGCGIWLSVPFRA